MRAGYDRKDFYPALILWFTGTISFAGDIDNLKVLHIGKFFPPARGGMEHYLGDLLPPLSHAEIDCCVVVHDHKFAFRSRMELLGEAPNQYPVFRSNRIANLVYVPICPSFPGLLKRVLKEFDPDLLHVHLPNASAFWLLANKSARHIPWVVQWHADVVSSDIDPLVRIFYKMYRPFESRVLNKAARIIVSSPPYLESSGPLQKWREKCRVIPLSIDRQRLVPAKTSDHETKRETFNLLAIGRLTYYKGFDYLIRALAQTKSVRLTLVGTGSLANELTKLALKLKIENRINFAGDLEDEELANELSTCDCLCLPSIERTEAFGLVLIEAMQFSKATIVSDVEGSGMAWVCDDGVTGIHVPPRNASALASAIQRLDDDPDLCAQLGKNGNDKFGQQFRMDKTVAMTKTLYLDTINTTAAIEDSASTQT